MITDDPKMQSYFSAVMLDSVQLDLFYYADDTNDFFCQIVYQTNFKFYKYCYLFFLIFYTLKLVNKKWTFLERNSSNAATTHNTNTTTNIIILYVK